jgi:hypothetical protein
MDPYRDRPSFAYIAGGKGGYWEDQGYPWFGGF